ncbi:MAG: DUF6287 domain-containing protein [Streptococcaceae bacterium]|jgi:uncharacterized protein YdbL (DUF1318 family)|nr:DUF6287 domain-containing protein [Streptococcaceae bacterium]
MATKEEWMNYFESLEGRKPTLAEFEAAKKSGEIDGVSEVEKLKQQQKAETATEIRKIPMKKTHTNRKVSRKGKITIIVAIVAVLSFVAGWFGYQAYQNSQTAKVLKDTVFVYKGKLVKPNSFKEVKSDFAKVEYQYSISDKLFFIQGQNKNATGTAVALMDNQGKTVDNQMTAYNASVKDGKLRSPDEAQAGDGISSVQSLYFSKKENAYYSSKTDFNQGVIKLSVDSVNKIIARRASGSFIVLNSKYYMDETDGTLSFREITSGDAIYNSKDNPEMFTAGAYIFSNHYMISEPKKSGKYYEYQVYNGQNLSKYLFTLKLPSSANSGQLSGDWTSDGDTFVTGKKDANGNYKLAIIVNMKTHKVYQLKLAKGDIVQPMGNLIAQVSSNKSVVIYDNAAKKVKTQKVNEKVVNVGSFNQEQKLENEAEAAVVKAEKLKKAGDAHATINGVTNGVTKINDELADWFASSSYGKGNIVGKGFGAVTYYSGAGVATISDIDTVDGKLFQGIFWAGDKTLAEEIDILTKDPSQLHGKSLSDFENITNNYKIALLGLSLDKNNSGKCYSEAGFSITRLTNGKTGVIDLMDYAMAIGKEEEIKDGKSVGTYTSGASGWGLPILYRRYSDDSVEGIGVYPATNGVVYFKKGTDENAQLVRAPKDVQEEYRKLIEEYSPESFVFKKSDQTNIDKSVKSALSLIKKIANADIQSELLKRLQLIDPTVELSTAKEKFIAPKQITNEQIGQISEEFAEYLNNNVATDGQTVSTPIPFSHYQFYINLYVETNEGVKIQADMNNDDKLRELYQVHSLKSLRKGSNYLTSNGEDLHKFTGEFLVYTDKRGKMSLGAGPNDGMETMVDWARNCEMDLPTSYYFLADDGYVYNVTSKAGFPQAYGNFLPSAEQASSLGGLGADYDRYAKATYSSDFDAKDKVSKANADVQAEYQRLLKKYTTVTEPVVETTSMNLNQIARGDFSSIAGTWQNQLGNTAVIGADGSFLNYDGTKWKLDLGESNANLDIFSSDQTLFSLLPNPGYDGPGAEAGGHGIVFTLKGKQDKSKATNSDVDRFVGYSFGVGGMRTAELNTPVEEHTYYKVK